MTVTRWKTKTDILNLPLPPAGKDYELHPDAELPGHYVRVTKHGVRTYVVDKHARGTRIRPKLGRAGTDALTPFQARQKARVALGMIAEGYTTAQIIERLARAEERVPPGAMTLEQLVEKTLKERGHKLSERTKADYKGLVDSYLPDWKTRPLEVIERDDEGIVTRFLSIKSHSRANYTFRALRMFFNYAMSIRDENDCPIVSRNPVLVLSKRKLWHKIDPRRDVIKQHQLRAWWKAVKGLRTEASYDNADSVRDWLMLMLLTGLRRTEAAMLRWENVDLRERTFTIPMTKNGLPHTLPMSSYLLTMFKHRHAEAGAPENDYVFPGFDGPIAEPQKLLAKVVRTSGVKFSPHTLRRTFSSVGESLDISFLALKRLMNHKVKDITSDYTQVSVERLREPMQKITDYFLRAAGERKAASVTSLDAKRKAVA